MKFNFKKLIYVILIALATTTTIAHASDKRKETDKSWKCVGCTPSENITLSYLQQRTLIEDKNSLATIMGNIKQESMFLPNICEGGARVSYDKCYSGGYGLIQWTTSGRYYGLGSFCKKYECDPSSLEGQLRYMVNENQFQNNLPYFEGAGMNVGYYMNAAYRWLGWGIHGNRTNYTYQYLAKLHYS
jgi:hypothetical protein